jgi:hypothetical protein
MQGIGEDIAPGTRLGEWVGELVRSLLAFVASIVLGNPVALAVAHSAPCQYAYGWLANTFGVFFQVRGGRVARGVLSGGCVGTSVAR